jgi:beta-N-acetylhexosaminidase
VRVDPAVRRAALSCLLLGWVGAEPPGWLWSALDDGLAGVVLFASNLGDGADVRSLTDRLRAHAGRELVIAVDEEGGDVTRFDVTRGSESPGAAALGRLDDVTVTEEVFAAIGSRCAAAGVTVDLAPVADVNSDPLNPVIGLRSFAAEPNHAARHVAAATRGLQASGVAACLKHFPGHGATRTDSHLSVARLDRTRTELDAVELVPFRAGIDAGARAVMTAHLLVPSLDADDLATTSRRITTDLLRAELGFAGTVLTDALEMRAVADTIGIAGGFVRALAAGADTVETGAQDHSQVLDELAAAVDDALRKGALTEQRLAEAAGRTRALAVTPALPATVPANLPVADELGARCLELVGELPRLQRPLVVECRPPDGIASGALPWSFGALVAERIPGTEVRTVDRAGAPPESGDRPLVLVVRDPQRSPWQQDLLAGAARHRCAVVVDVGWPAPPPAGVPLIRTRGVAPGLLAAAADLLAGRAVR